uniref:Uncharacterized protein n=1 Tax=viral metagenome TaxID=1070528 RepID=A0A6C0I334_9ZZZZ
MDDFVISNLHESRNEWCCRLISILSPLVIEGIKSIFNESWNLCLETNEPNKYLMTFQNLIGRVPKWNAVIIEEERKRIVERSGCNYLEDLITCVHIIQLKILTCIRVGNKQKKIDISIPKLDTFLHKIYIHAARKVYMNVYLFDKSVTPLQVQKNLRELEMLIQECILMAIRESIPTEQIIRAYMEENVEHEEEVVIERLQEAGSAVAGGNMVDSSANIISITSTATAAEAKEIPAIVPSIQNVNEEKVVTKLTFSDIDSVLDETNREIKVEAPKSIERLEEISTSRAIQRKLEEQAEAEEDRIKIHSDPISLDLGLIDLSDTVGSLMPSPSPSPSPLPSTKLDDVVVLTDVMELF